MRLFSTVAAVLLTATLTAQGVDILVATRLPAGNPATRLLLVDSSTGTFQTIQRFPSDNLPPLAVTFDGYDGEVVLAVADTNVSSRIVRLRLAGTSVLAERTIGQLPANCTHLEVLDDSVCAAAIGPAGGFYRLPRFGGMPVRILAEPEAAAMTGWGPSSTSLNLAWSSTAVPARGPGFGTYDLRAGAWSLGPWNEPSLGARTVTGIGDLPTALVRQAVSFADGGFELVVYGGPGPTPIATVPPIPNGGAAAMKPLSPGSFSMRCVGSAAFPWLYGLEVWGLMPNVAMLAGPLPGDPVDLAIAPTNATSMLVFGRACGTPPPHLNSRGWPVIGNLQFAIDLSGGAPLQPTVFVAGLSDSTAAGGALLPYVLPSGCELRVAPDACLFQVSDASGNARQNLPIPNQPGLVGLRLFGQWLQSAAVPFAASEGTALVIGL